MYKKIYRAIKKYDTIVIARHVGVDPDAMASQLGLKESIEETFPHKKVYAIGNGTNKFSFLGKLDKYPEDLEDCLLIVLDTPDKKRVDGIENLNYSYSIKIDHHPFVEEFCNLELIDEQSSSACQLVIEMLYKTKLKRNKSIMEKLFQGLVSDTNRFLFQNSTARTFSLVGKVIDEYHLDLPSLYESLYLRPLKEVRLQGYISQNMTVTDNGVGYIEVTSQIINKFNVDAGSAGNMVNNFNYIDEVLVWLTISEDTKNEIIKVNIRSRGPVINTVAEKYHGGGHKYAAGARVSTMEEAELLINDLDRLCKEYIDENIKEVQE